MTTEQNRRRLLPRRIFRHGCRWCCPRPSHAERLPLAASPHRPAGSPGGNRSAPISVATFAHGGVSAAAIASAISPATTCGDLTSRTHPRHRLRQASTISLVSSASAARCHVALIANHIDNRRVGAPRGIADSPSPLARPGPRCSNVIAGLPDHPRVAIGSHAGADALEQREHRAHSPRGTNPARRPAASRWCQGCWRNRCRR